MDHSEESKNLVPLYGFVEGDVVGLLIFGYQEDTIGALGYKACKSAALRVKLGEHFKVLYKGAELDPKMTVKEVGLTALDRFDVCFA